VVGGDVYNMKTQTSGKKKEQRKKAWTSLVIKRKGKEIGSFLTARGRGKDQLTSGWYRLLDLPQGISICPE